MEAPETRSKNTGKDFRRLEKAYKSERPKLLARLRAAGRTIEEAEDLLHDVYAETLERLPVIS